LPNTTVIVDRNKNHWQILKLKKVFA
jgi:hypothetical protein